MKDRLNILSRNRAVAYLFTLVVVLSTFALRMWLIPLTGTGAPFALFFAAILLISLLAGVGPGLLAVFLSMPLATHAFVVRAGYPVFQAVFQSLLFLVDGFVAVYLTNTINKGRREVQVANQQLSRANECLRESEERFRLTIDEAPIGMALVARDGRFLRVNRVLCEIVGYSADELTNRTFQSITHPDDVEPDVALADRLAAGGIPRYQFGKRYIRKDGSIVDATLSVSVLRGPRGEFLNYISQIEDITERKRADEALRRAVAARDHVLAIVVHDLRNPLSNIIMASSKLKLPGSQTDRQEDRHGEMVLRAAKRMEHLINDLLDVTQIEAGQLKIEPGRLSARDLVYEAVQMQSALASASGVEIRVAVQSDLSEIWADRDRLLQVLENLIGNAIKFTTPGGYVTVGTSTKEAEILFWITDTGCGIAAENLSHIFDRFWQVASRAGRLGAGLGLPITKGILDAHRGRIWVESTVGQGSTFFFTIPKAPAALRLA
jgi:PAS domain S-box-containing protein